MSAIALGIIGCGRAARELHLPALRTLPEDWKVAALADLEAPSLDALGKTCPGARRYRQPEELLADPAVTAALICTPAATHAALALAALAAGKHVLVEKPLAPSLAEGEEMAAAAASSSRLVTAAGFNQRCHRLVRRARPLVASGALGEIHHLNFLWSSPMQHAPNFPAWRHRAATGGGALLEIGSHQLDLARFLLEDEFSEIQMLERSGRYEQESVGLLGRSRKGVLVSCTLTQTSAFANEVRILGDRASVSFSLFRAESFRFAPVSLHPGGWRSRLPSRSFLRELPELVRIARAGGDFFLSYRAQWQAFAGAIRSGTPPAASWTDGLAALRAADAALNSAGTGASVRVSN